jgi:hypothetical protein
MVTQLITLLSVLLGGASSYLAGSARERVHYRRNLDQRWTERKLDAYATYLSDIKKMRVIARRIVRDTVLDPNLPESLERDEGLPLLAEAEANRSVSAEIVLLVGSEEVINSLRVLNQAVWRIEWFARGLIDNADTDAWNQAASEYFVAINSFQECVRRDVRVPGSYPPRRRVGSWRDDNR